MCDEVEQEAKVVQMIFGLPSDTGASVRRGRAYSH